MRLGAAATYWDRRIDTLALQSRELDAELEKVLARLTDTFTEEQMDIYVGEFEHAMNLQDANVKEFFYKTGFKDAVRFLYGILQEAVQPQDSRQ